MLSHWSLLTTLWTSYYHLMWQIKNEGIQWLAQDVSYSKWWNWDLNSSHLTWKSISCLLQHYLNNLTLTGWQHVTMRKVIMVNSNLGDFDSFLGEGSICWSDMGTKSLNRKYRGSRGRKNPEKTFVAWATGWLEYRGCMKVGLECYGKIQR